MEGLTFHAYDLEGVTPEIEAKKTQEKLFIVSDNDIGIRIERLSRAGGGNLFDAIEWLIAAYLAKKSPILPYEFVRDSREVLVEYVKRRKVLACIVDLPLVFSNIHCCVLRDDEWFSIDRCFSPPNQGIRHIPRKVFDNLGVCTTTGYQVISGSGMSCIDYVVGKYDGMLYQHYYLEGEIKTGLTVFNNSCWLDSFAFVCTGELMGYGDINYPYLRRLVVNYASHQEAYPSCIMLEGCGYPIYHTSCLTLDVVRDGIVDPECDGIVVCVDGTEYKIKHRCTIDLKWSFSLNCFLSSDGRKFDLSDIYHKKDRAIMVDGAIYECYLFEGHLQIVQIRKDKVFPQSGHQYNEIIVSPTVTDFRMLVKSIMEPKFEQYRDVFSVDAMAVLVRDDLMKLDDHDFLISPGIVGSILARHQLRFDKQLIDSVASRMIRISLCNRNNNKGTIARIDRDDLNRIKRRNVGYATCSKIYEWAEAKKVAVTPLELATMISFDTGLIVSVRKIAMMAGRGELFTIGSRVMAHKCAGHFCGYRERTAVRRFRHKFNADEMTVYSALCSYSLFNGGKMALDTEIKALMSEDRELCSVFRNVDVDQRQNCYEETGDVLMMVVKVILRMYTSGAPLVDQDARIWKILFGLDVMQPFLKKMKSRVGKYQCVRSHATALNHICSSGEEFVASGT